MDSKNAVLYVGKAKDLKQRVASYFVNRADLGEKTKLLVSKIKKIKAIPVASEIESLLLEANFIKKYDPPYNIMLTDGKAYPLIRITIEDTYPKVLVARRMDDANSLYFGPYPNTGAMRLVLKTVRRIFPFQSVPNHSNRICLYNHLGLCPCPTVSGDTDYKKNIHHLIKFLSGKTKAVIKGLEKDRDGASKLEDFEKARELQEKIDAILLITNPVHKPFEYETNPNLRVDLRNNELLSLQQILGKARIQTRRLHRIECYDISNTMGKQSVGSMVVFINGEKESSLYRRFKINGVTGPNDFASMEEVIQRRLKHTEWGMPDLLIVDGGKGQVTSAVKVLRSMNYKIPLIGLAKREETIITPEFKPVSLPKNEVALQLIMRIRDEAHRFAIAYHRKLRSKAALQ